MTSTQEIIEKIINKQEDGLRLLYANYSEVLFGMAFRILARKSFAEDALQQSFLKIWNNMESYDAEKSTLFTWMAKIVRNTAIDISRLKSFQNELKTETIDPLVHNTDSSHINVAKIDVEGLLEGMDEKYRIVLEYLYLKGYSQSELSEKMDIPLGTIKTRCKKAIDIVRNKLKSENKLMLGGLILILILVKLFML
ncbi:MAG: sigma-70 family RNA polymerase sigma factor [Saprospiraceae bacterium]|nr:sigma-70 family RNA polymerase sigma factor [Saprospiraceae bacterium]